MTLYLKYRPKNLEELDLKDVSQSLKHIVESNNIPHAFLFSGPKGTGKTSAARILAKIVNCTDKKNLSMPCDKCDQCISIAKGNNLDVIEMDAASNRGIDDIRTLKDSIKLSPALATKKIYIIDEAHMLTTEASNALLKTLEEPPEHVIFILATTNPEKLIETVVSRSAVINFRKATNEEIVSSLKRVMSGEKLKISEKVLESIANKSNGAFRDATKLLEQVSIQGEGFLDNLESGVNQFMHYIENKNKNESLAEIDKVVAAGGDIEEFLKLSLLNVQSEIVSGRIDFIDLAELFIIASDQMKSSPIQELPIQIAVIKWCQGEPSPSGKIEPEKPDTSIDNLPPSNLPDNVAEGITPPTGSIENDMWQKVLFAIKPVNASLEALLRTSKPLNYDGTTLTLGVYYKFHKERLEDSSHRKVVEEIITNVLNNKTNIACKVVEAPITAPLTEDKDKDIIRVAEEIFG